MTTDTLTALAGQLAEHIKTLGTHDEQIEALNTVKRILHTVSPMSSQPVDCVLWIKKEHVIGNDYNPNTVATPEMKLLETSVKNNGFTMPIVTWDNNDEEGHPHHLTIVDGFHRSLVGKKKPIAETLYGYLPVSIIDAQTDKSGRIAATVRHNAARGKHQLDGMAQIVQMLKSGKWTDLKICKEIGISADALLKLKQQTGLPELFAGQSFSRSWITDDETASVLDVGKETESQDEEQ